MVMLHEDELTVPTEVLERLRCLQCAEPIVNDGGLVCGNGHAMHVRNGYIDALALPPDTLTARTFVSFGYEHTTFVERQREEEQYWRYFFAGIRLDELRHGVGLDAGCGSGRFARFLAPRLRTLVALDGSMAVGTAARNLAAFPNTVVVRSDLRATPFAPGSFDFITCIGVLHHMDRADEAFHSLARLIAPGGRILMFVYSRPLPGSMRWFVVSVATTLRKVTVHMPHPLLRIVSAIVASALYVSGVLPGKFGERFRVRRLSALPLAFYRRLPLRSLWLSTFDVLSAPLERRYAWREIEPWFLDTGLAVDSVRDDHGLIVLAHRPEATSP